MGDEPQEKHEASLDADKSLEFEGVWFPPITKTSILQRLKTFEIREDDLIVSTYPKSGTHWIEEVLHLMEVDGHVDRIKRDVDNYFGLEFGFPPNLEHTTMDLLESRPSPRFYMTHVPCQLLPDQVWTKKPKIVYVTRNPKDACCSWYRFVNANPRNKEPIPFDAVFSKFITEKAPFGNWCDHSLGYWEHRNDENIIFITYEEIKKDIRLVVRRLEKFLGWSITADGMERIIEHSSIEGMKKTYARIEDEYENGRMYTRAFGIMPFIHKGVAGGWKGQFTDEQSDKMDRMVGERLAGTGLDAHYPQTQLV